MKYNHYGVDVDSDVAIVGVIGNCTPIWLPEETNDGIDLNWEGHIATCPNEDHDLCFESLPDSTYLLGSWVKDSDGLYTPDQAGEYSAIMQEIYTQVVWSRHTKRCALCSLCYPGQGNLDTPGEYLTYDVPPDLYGVD